MSVEADKISRNAMYVLFAMTALFAFVAGMLTWVILVYGFREIPGEVIAFFSAGLGILGTVIGTLIQTLWGKS